MLTEIDFCDYDTCVALWSMGLIPHPYDNTDTDKVMAIISLYEAQKWLREEKGIVVEITLFPGGYGVSIIRIDRQRNEVLWGDWGFNSYEGALSKGIKEAVKILKEYEADKVL